MIDAEELKDILNKVFLSGEGGVESFGVVWGVLGWCEEFWGGVGSFWGCVGDFWVVWGVLGWCGEFLGWGVLGWCGEFLGWCGEFWGI